MTHEMLDQIQPVPGSRNNWPFAGPEGCVENGPAAVPRPRDRSRINLDMLRSSRLAQRPILTATKAVLVTGQDTRSIFQSALIEE